MRGWPLVLPFRFSLAAGVRDEVGLGTLWAPSLLEDLSISVNQQPVRVYLWAAPGRLPLGQAVGSFGSDRVGEMLYEPVGDAVGGNFQFALALMATGTAYRVLGRWIPWAPIYLAVSVVNNSLAAGDFQGEVRVRVDDEARSWGVVPVVRELAPHLGRGHGDPMRIGLGS